MPQLPEGFQLDEQQASTGLPEGFVVDKPEQVDKKRGVVGATIEEVFTRPAATSREAIRANPALALTGPLAGLAGLAGIGGEKAKKSATEGALNPDESKTFQESMLEKHTPQTRSTALNFIGGLPANVAGLAADIVTSPAEALSTLLPETRIAKAIGKTKPVLAMKKFINKPISFKPEQTQLLRKAIEEPLTKAVRPTVRGRKDFNSINKFKDKAIDAISIIDDNVDNLVFKDARTGQDVSRAPESLEELSSAIAQTKSAIWSQIDEGLAQAGEKGVKVATEDLTDELIKVAYDESLDVIDQNVRRYAEQKAIALDKIGEMNVGEVETMIQRLNQKLSAFYKNPTTDAATGAQVDAMIVNKLRNTLDESVSSVSDVAFKDLKKKYGSLKTIEEDVAKRSIVDSRKNPVGLIDFTDIFSAGDVARGALSGNPALIAKGGLQGALKTIAKIRNDPNRMVKNMFKAVSKAKKQNPRTLKNTNINPRPIGAIAPIGALSRTKKENE